MSTMIRASSALRAALALLALSAASAGAAQAQRAAPTGARAAADPTLRFSALAELAGDSVAAAVLVRGDARPEMLQRAAARLEREAQAASAAGRPLEAARRWELLTAELPSAGVLPRPWLDLSPERLNGHLAAAAGAYAAAGDSVRSARALRTLALLRGDPDQALEAFSRSVRGADAERTVAFLVLEHLLRKGVRAGGVDYARLSLHQARADSLLLMWCRATCSTVSDEPAALTSALEEELGERPGRPYYRRGPVQEALRTLFARSAADALTPREQSALLLYISDAPLDSLRAAGHIRRLAAILHARAYERMPRAQFAGAFADAERALREAQEALTLRRRAGDRAGEARTLALAGLALLRMSRPDSARALHQAAEAVARGADPAVRALVARRAGQGEAVRGNADAAERRAGEASALREPGDGGADHLVIARALTGSGAGPAALRQARRAAELLRVAPTGPYAHPYLALGAAHREAGGADSAAHYFRAAARAFGEAGSEAEEAGALAALAETELERGRLAEARAALNGAAAAMRRRPTRALLSDVRDVEARILNDEGYLYFAEAKWGEAESLFRAVQRHTNGTHAEHREAERNLALVQIATTPREALTDQAMAAAGDVLDWRATADFSRTDPPRARVRPLTQGWMMTYAALLNLHRAQLPQAEAALAAALPLLERAGHAPSLRRMQGVRGAMFARLGRADSAAVYTRLAGEFTPVGMPAQAAGGGAAPVRTPRELAQTLPPARAVPELRRMLAESQTVKDPLGEALALEALGFVHFRRSQPADLATATAFYDSAMGVRGRLWLRGLSDWQRVQFAEQFVRLQEEATLAWLARAPQIGDPAAAAASGAVADRGRGQAFKWLAQEAGAQDEGLAADVWRAALSSGSLPEVGKELFSDAFGRYAWNLNRRGVVLSYLATRDTLIVWVASRPQGASSPTVRAFRRAVPADSVAALVSRARAAMTITPSARAVESLEPNLRSRGLGVGVDAAPDGAVMRTLAELLLPEEVRILAAQPGGELLVVAGGGLASLPFTALPLDTVGTPLSAKLSVRYLSSLAAQHYSRESAASLPAAGGRRDWLARAVVLGNPRMPGVRQADGEVRPLTPLPGAEAEARAVAARMGVAPLTGDAATLEALRSRVRGATVLHLATHGFAYASESRVEDSFVALAPTSGDDGLLTVRKLLADRTLRLPAADLVVLSACQTGLGQTTTSEGTLGLQRAFFAAGAESMLVSLWSVSDEATAALLDGFYRHWLEDADAPNKAEALRRAQEEIRRDSRHPEWQHPAFWSAFQLIGID
jgi:hypothetical protein